jgi:hypothetical protein
MQGSKNLQQVIQNKLPKTQPYENKRVNYFKSNADVDIGIYRIPNQC